MNLVLVNPAELKPHPRNSRVHSPEQIALIKASIEKFGFRGAIVIDENGFILAGHGRTLAAIAAGLDTIPADQRLGMTEEEKRAFILADNKIGEESSWDKKVVAEEVDYLKAVDFDLGVIGFNDRELKGLLALAEAAPDATSPAPEPKKARTIKIDGVRLTLAQDEEKALGDVLSIYMSQTQATDGFFGWLASRVLAPSR